MSDLFYSTYLLSRNSLSFCKMISHFWNFCRACPALEADKVMQTNFFKDLKMYSFHMKTREIRLICFKNLVKLLFEIKQKTLMTVSQIIGGDKVMKCQAILFTLQFLNTLSQIQLPDLEDFFEDQGCNRKPVCCKINSEFWNFCRTCPLVQSRKLARSHQLELFQ